MKILDVPQSGKRGITVSQGGRYGQISRALAIPTNPRTAGQLAVRQRLAAVAARWRTLTQAQRDAWDAEGKNHQSKSRLGQSGPLTGAQLFIRLNFNLLQTGQAQVDTPSSAPEFPALAVTGLSITNTSGTIALKLATSGSPGDYTLIRASAPQSQGHEVCSEFRFIGLCPTPTNNVADITSLYVAKFGAPPVGTKVFVQANQIADGYEDIPHGFVAIVPAAS